jgi:ABC-type transport system involved in multi-copper enzyme maturation permease subunit
MTVGPGRDLRLLWPHRFTLFGDGIELAGTKGAPLGLEVLILQKLLATGLGGTILLLVSVAVTAGFVPNMVRKGTLELLLVRPIPRWQLLVFKYVGALLLVAALLGILVLAVWLITGILADVWSPGVLLALPSLLVFFALLLAVSVLTGVITRSVISAMLVTVAYWAVLFIAGQMNNVAVESRIREANVGKMRPTSIAETIRGRQPRREEPLKPGRKPFYQTTVGRITEGLYAGLPHTEDLDNLVDRQLMRDFAVAGPFRALMESGEFSWEKGLGLTLLHTVAYLAIACTIFSRRDP